MTAPTLTFTPVQERLAATAFDGKSRIIGFGGGIRGTKTWGTLALIVTLCRMFPKSRWVVVRKDWERIRKNTLPSFNKLRDRVKGFVDAVKVDTAKCRNGSEILFFGENIDKDPTLSRWHGFEANGILLEEADEMSERSFIKSIERSGTWIVPDGVQPPPYIFATFNPTPLWPKRVFYDPWLADTIKAPYAFIPATQADNPFISDEQREAWKEMSEIEYKRFVMGDWSVLTGRYYDVLDARVHLKPRAELPDMLPPWWEYWGAFDWGYGHWAVFGVFGMDPEGTVYLLDSWWARRQQDPELALGCKRLIADLKLPVSNLPIYAGHDVKAKVTAHGASGKTVQDVFAEHGLYLSLADIDKANGGRAVRRMLAVRNEKPSLYIVEAEGRPGNRRVFDQLSETMPDKNDIDKPAKIDCDDEGRGGDDGADMLRYGIATRFVAPVEPTVTDHAREALRDPTLDRSIAEANEVDANPEYVNSGGLPWGF